METIVGVAVVLAVFGFTWSYRVIGRALHVLAPEEELP